MNIQLDPVISELLSNELIWLDHNGNLIDFNSKAKSFTLNYLTMQTQVMSEIFQHKSMIRFPAVCESLKKFSHSSIPWICRTDEGYAIVLVKNLPKKQPKEPLNLS